MWCKYNKVFTFRDCLADEIVDSNVQAINKLLAKTQKGGSTGATIADKVLTVVKTVDKIEASRDEETDTLDIYLYSGNGVIALVSLWDIKEVQLDFDIEEDLETGEFIIHSCTVNAFTVYQI